MPPAFRPPAVPSSARAGIGAFRTVRELVDATLLRCGGCGDSVLLTQGERDYGQLVHSFLGGHELCRSAVEITRSPIAASGAAAA
jgi:hypothetical protein